MKQRQIIYRKVGVKMTITIIRAVIIYIFVIIAVRVMGKRQLGELSTHEFVITILISAVATVPLEENSIPLTNSLLPIIIFISLEIIESAVSMKFPSFSELLEGKPIFVIKDGKLQQNEMKRLRFTMNDILDSLRQQGVFDVSEVENAIVETNGKLSIQKKSASPSLPTPLVIDGEKVKEYFGDEKVSDAEIELVVKASGKKLNDIMLLTLDENGRAYLIKKEK